FRMITNREKKKGWPRIPPRHPHRAQEPADRLLDLERSIRQPLAVRHVARRALRTESRHSRGGRRHVVGGCRLRDGLRGRDGVLRRGGGVIHLLHFPVRLDVLEGRFELGGRGGYVGFAGGGGGFAER